MSEHKGHFAAGRLEPLSIEQLETGLRIMQDSKTDRGAFWDENIGAFRQTVLFAIRETSDALLSPTLQQPWRAELESQLRDLIRYIGLADRYLARRPDLAISPVSFRPH